MDKFNSIFMRESTAPQIMKLYIITYRSSLSHEQYTSLVYGSDEFSAINNFRQIGSTQKFSDIIGIKLYEIS